MKVAELQKRSIFIGFDPREADAFAVARASARRSLLAQVPIAGIHLAEMRAAGLYVRPTSTKDGRLWDDISEAPMATESAENSDSTLMNSQLRNSPVRIR